MVSIPKLSVSIQPLGDRVVVMPLEAEMVTASGIVLPENAKGEKPQQGMVIAMGKGGITKDSVNPHDYLKIGDKVLFGRYSGDEVKLKDDKGKEIELKILHLDSVLGIVK